MIHRKTIIVLLGLLIICCTSNECFAENGNIDISNEILNEYADSYGDLINDNLESLDGGNPLKNISDDISVKELFKEIIGGRLSLSPKEIVHSLVKAGLDEVYVCLKFMALITALAVLCSYLTGLKDGFGENGVSTAAFYICYIVIASVASAAFYRACDCVSSTVENISVFMKMIVPVVITTLVSSGAVVSASVFEPVLITIVEISVTVIESVLIPLVMVTAAMNIVNNVSDRFKTQKMTNFINKCVKWGLCILLTIFVSTAGIQSIAASGADGLTVKLTKFAASNLIPVVGGILSESVETVMNCSVLIKNSVGIIGIICLVATAAFPLIKIAAILIIFRLTAGIAEPISEPKIISCITEIANSISLLFSMLAASTVMFIIVLTVVINAGNTVIMLGR